MAKRKKTGGGSRKGKPNKSTQEIREIIQSTVDFAVLTDKMFQLVKGVEVSGDDGTVYSQAPNVNAAKLLLEYGYGKPKEVVDLNVGINTAEICKQFAEMVRDSGSGEATF